MQEAYRRATLSDVMRHTAGLPPYERISPAATPIMFELKGTPAEQRARFAEHVLMEEPGAPGRFAYSNAGFSIIGHVTERRGGKPWEDLMKAEVFTPLKMSSAVIGRATETSGVPLGHRRTESGFRAARQGPPVAGVLAPAGGVRLAIADFARFVAFQADPAGNPAFLRKQTAAALLEQRAADSGAGEGQAVFGGEGTFNAGFAAWPGTKFGIAVCVNGGDSDEACQAVINAVRDRYAPDIAPPETASSPAHRPSAPA
jgi:CubicO group peptidase (beta-lactamase class C family)